MLLTTSNGEKLVNNYALLQVSIQCPMSVITKECVCVCSEFLCQDKVCVFSYLSWQPVIDYCNEKYDQYLRDESGLNRRNIEDHRVHCCLYFINPLGHG